CDGCWPRSSVSAGAPSSSSPAPAPGASGSGWRATPTSCAPAWTSCSAELRESLRCRPQVAEQVADLVDAPAGVADRPAVRAELRVVELVPSDRHRHRRAGRGPHAVGGDERLVPRVLRVVEPGEPAPLTHAPLPADELRHRLADRLRHGLDPRAGFLEGVAV